MSEKTEAQLIIREPGKPECTIPLTLPSMIVGRSRKTSDLEIRHDSISRKHVRFFQENNHYLLEDLGSTHGTQVNGQPLAQGKKHHLRNGDAIRLGHVTLIFKSRGEEPKQAAHETIHFDKLSQLLNLPSFTIGRDKDVNALPLKHPSISRQHAEIKKTDRGYIIKDLHSTNGTFVNGQQVRGKYFLRQGDEIRIGPFKIVYSDAGFSQARSMFGYRLDAFDLLREVQQNGQKKAILKKTNLSIYPREFIALVGGSGAGKSTLMKALSGFVPANSGKVLVNGDHFYENYANYRNIIGYVPQDDIVHKQLSARRALLYSAKLRLPDNTEPEFIRLRVDEALALVEMTNHADTPIAQLSGGQRKRVSIAVELLGDPKLFFLDEPTSGLDPGLEKKMMEMLRKRAEDEDGRIIVLVTHATGNINQCSQVAFMADGQLVYFGPPQQACAYFGDEDFADIYMRLSAQNAESLSEKFQRSDLHQQYVTRRQKECETSPQAVQTSRQAIARKASSFKQFQVLAQRYFELIRRDMTSLLTLLVVMPFIGLLLLIMSNPYDLIGKNQDEIRTEIHQELDEARGKGDPNIGDEQFSGTYTVVSSAQKLLFMFALAASLLGIFAAAYELVKEDAIYQRERMVNLKIPPYLCSKIVVLGLFALLQCLLLLAVVGIKLKYPSEGVFFPAIGEMYLTLVLATLASICLGLFISAFVRNSNTVIYIILVVLFMQIIFAGAIFELPAAAKPISYLTTTRWALEALGSTVDMQALKAQSVSCVEIEGKDTRETKAPCKYGQLRQGIDFTFHVEYEHQQMHLLIRWLVLLGFAGLFAILAGIVQQRKDALK